MKCLLLFISLCISFCGPDKGTREPLIWDMTLINNPKKNPSSPETKIFLKNCDIICKKPPVSVTLKAKTYAPDIHYYCSIGTYWWPKRNNPQQYYHKDGETNPECKEYDITYLKELASRCQKLSKAFYITGEMKYYDALLKQIKVWFLNQNTYMLPNFEYAQVIPGRNNNKGRSTGMIDAYNFNTVIESIRLVNGVKKIDNDTMSGLKSWFETFARWADEGEFGNKQRENNNNIGTAFDITLINMYLFSGNNKRAKQIADEFASKRINTQIDSEGKQKAELIRPNAFTYSLKNLGYLFDFCYLARYWDRNYYKKHGASLDRAIAYLEQFVDNQKAFPYKQKSGWEKCRHGINRLIFRRDMLIKK